VTIIPRGRAGGYTIPLPEEERSYHTKKELLDRVTSLLGGRAAEDVFLDDISTGAQNDMERATRLVRAMVTEYGMSEKIGPLTLGQKHDEQIFLGRDISRQRNYSEEVAAAIDHEISSIINQCYQKAISLLKENAATVEKIVNALIERETLDSEDIKKLMRGETLEPIDKKDRVLQLNFNSRDREKEEKQNKSKEDRLEEVTEENKVEENGEDVKEE
ncbi:MAG: cell division protein FtsH, partial [Halanaerobiales bacterium]